MLHPVRHADPGDICRAQSPDACEKAFPDTHHQPRHCLDVPAVDFPHWPNPNARHRADVPRQRRGRVSTVNDLLDQALGRRYQTTEAKGLTR